jgi:hypothetical protein
MKVNSSMETKSFNSIGNKIFKKFQNISYKVLFDYKGKMVTAMESLMDLTLIK